MIENPRTVSVVVVSRDRPRLLPLCLTGLGQSFYPRFEIVVVTDHAGRDAVRDMGWMDRVKLVAFDEPNISAARNAGIAAAAGEIVAFIDDDAVPEPTWLLRLVSGFNETGAHAAGGFVRGRDGITYQSRANLVNAFGATVPLDVRGETAFLPTPPEGHAVKTEGTNCAFLRKTLAELGGFDPVYRYYHDDTDLNMRLARAGYETAIVPGAQVHHGYAASPRRGADTAPRSLFEIGASQAVFLARHAPGRDRARALESFREGHRRRLLRHMVQGGLEPRDVRRLMEDLDAGIADGRDRGHDPLPPLGPPPEDFLPFVRAGATGKSTFIAGRSWTFRTMCDRARAQADGGDVVTVLSLSPTVRPHRMRFTRGGYWVQQGGLFGRAGRTDPAFQTASFRVRAQKESERIAKERQIAQTPDAR